MTKKTLAILGAGLALVATAAVAGQGRLRRHNAGPTSTSTPNGRAQVDLGFGSMTVALADPKVLLDQRGDTYVALGLEARTLDGKSARPTVRMALVIDHSGSMAGAKLEHVKRAAQGVAARLGDQDQVALIQYDNSVQVLVPMSPLQGAGRTRLQAAIEGIQPGGSTNLHGGLEAGRDQALASAAGAGVNRVLLLSDGLANTGVVAPAAIAATAQQAADRGVRISTVGVGLDYNEDLMEAIAENGRGQYSFVDNVGDMEKVFATELGALQATVARQVAVRIEPAAEGVAVVQALGYEARHEGNALVVSMADLFGGDRRQLLVKVRLPAKKLGLSDAVRVRLSYEEVAQKRPGEALATVGYEVSSDAIAVQAAADRDAHTRALQAETAAAMRAAAAEYEQGRSAVAQQMLARQQAYVQAQAQQLALPSTAVAEPLNQLKSTSNNMGQFDFGSLDGKRLLKSSKSSARSLSKSGNVKAFGF
jgi:Ca-activated chloride channel family protein